MARDVSPELLVLEARLRRLEDEAAIRAVVESYGRAIDRNDPVLLAELFHPDADVHYGEDIYEGNAVEFVKTVLAFQAKMTRSQHLIGQCLIVLEGDTALTETYGQPMQLYHRNGKLIEIGTGCRYLDRFERRNGAWKIASRRVVVDWFRELEMDEALFTQFKGPPKGDRGMLDLSGPFFASHKAGPFAV